MSGYFKDVYTAKDSKAAAILDILHKENALAQEVVFVGDSLGDMNSAKEAGVPFIGRQAGQDFPKGQFPVFNDMGQVLAHLQDKI